MGARGEVSDESLGHLVESLTIFKVVCRVLATAGSGTRLLSESIYALAVPTKFEHYRG